MSNPPVPTPTPADLQRDLEADLALAEQASAGPWRNTIRRESPAQMAKAVRENGGVGNPRCSEAVVRGNGTPAVQDVICWMGPGASRPDDIVDARLIAAARTGWPAAIRRALAAEAENRQLRAQLEALQAARP